MKKVNSELSLATSEPAFCIVGIPAEYDEPGVKPDTPVRTTITIIRANEAFVEKYVDLVDSFNTAHTRTSELEWDALEEFRAEACGLVCSKDAEIRHLGFNAFAVTWRRVAIKGGKK